MRVVISHKQADVTEVFQDDAWEAKLQKGSSHKLLENTDIARRILPGMIQTATKLAETQAAALQASRLRLDSLRLIWKGPPETLK